MALTPVPEQCSNSAPSSVTVPRRSPVPHKGKDKQVPVLGNSSPPSGSWSQAPVECVAQPTPCQPPWIVAEASTSSGYRPHQRPCRQRRRSYLSGCRPHRFLRFPGHGVNPHSDHHGPHLSRTIPHCGGRPTSACPPRAAMPLTMKGIRSAAPFSPQTLGTGREA